MSDSDPSSSPSRSPTPARAAPAPPRLPHDVLTRIARFLTVDTGEDPHDTLEDRQKDALSMARVCKAWRAAGTVARWREIEVELNTSRALLKHVEAHRSLSQHVQSVMINLGVYTWGVYMGETRSTVPSILANCPRLCRLEFIGGRLAVPGPLFQALQDKVDLSRLTTVVVTWGRETHTWSGARDPSVLSPLLLFTFLRKCTNLRSFAFDVWGDLIRNPAPGPPDRRFKLASLRLDIKNPADDEAQIYTLNMRMRFLANFNLAHLTQFTGAGLFTHKDWWIAFDQMRNLESLKLRADFALKTGGLDELSSRLPRLVSLARFDLRPVGPCGPRDEGAPTVVELQRLLNALPRSLEEADVWLPIPESVVDRFLDAGMRTKFRRFQVFVYDPLDRAATSVLQRYSRP
ncbi:hypothetical protein JCM3770_006151 [Rhodotorula araucariae]